MEYSRLFILVEGDDDERFIERIIKHLLIDKYHDIRVWQYSRQKKEKTASLLRSISQMGADYIFIRDINSSPCISERKETVLHAFPHVLDAKRVQITVKEIESWYLAGLCDSDCMRLLQKPIHNTDSLTKEQFNSLIPSQYDSRIHFIQDILSCYSIGTAKQKNKSFKYFMERFIIQ